MTNKAKLICLLLMITSFFSLNCIGDAFAQDQNGGNDQQPLSDSNRIVELKNLHVQPNWTFVNNQLETNLSGHKKSILGFIGASKTVALNKEERLIIKPLLPIDENTFSLSLEHSKDVSKVLIELYRGETKIWDNASSTQSAQTVIRLNNPISFTDETYELVARSESVDVKLVITKLNYSEAHFPCSINKVTFSDKKDVQQIGDGNHIVSPFEVIRLSIVLACDSWRENVMSVSLDPSAHLRALTPFKLKPLSEGDTTDLKIYEALVTPVISDELKLRDSINVKIDFDYLGIKTSRDLSIPYQHILGDSLALNSHLEERPFDFASKEELDTFLSTYPTSESAPVIFALRNAIPREKALTASTTEDIVAAINEYNEFINQYSNYTGALLSQRDVFKLYEKLNTLDGYIDFIKRYPASVESHLADERIKRLVFDAVMAQDDLDAYDFYVSEYPNAHPYVDQVIEKAKIIYSNAERDRVEALRAQMDLNNDAMLYKFRSKVSDWASEIILALYSAKDRLKKTDLQIGEMKMLKVQMDRYSYTIENYYKDTPSLQTVLHLKDTQEILGALSKLSDLVQNNHQELKQQLQSEFSGVRALLTDRFDRVDQSLNAIEARLIAQEKIGQDLNKRLDDLSQLVDNHYSLIDQMGATLNTSVLIAVRGGKEALSKMSAHMPSVDGFKRFSRAAFEGMKTTLQNSEIRKIVKLDSIVLKTCKLAPVLITSAAVLNGVPPFVLAASKSASKKACNWAFDKLLTPQSDSAHPTVKQPITPVTPAIISE